MFVCWLRCRRRCPVEGEDGAVEDKLLVYLMENRRQEGVECANCEKVSVM